MKEKYWNPALERTDNILKLIAADPNQYRLIDLSRRLDINKSSMYTLLNTLEKLGWIRKESGGLYSLGTTLAFIGASYLSQFNILQAFYEEAAETKKVINESLQIGVLDNGYVIYTGKLRGDSLVQLVTQPGMRFPAYASSIGKILLSQYPYEELKTIYPEEPLTSRTENTITSIAELYEQLKLAREQGFAEEHEESAEEIHCVAAPVYDYKNQVIAGVSIVMTTNHWNKKKEVAKAEVVELARRLSQRSGQQIPYK